MCWNALSAAQSAGWESASQCLSARSLAVPAFEKPSLAQRPVAGWAAFAGVNHRLRDRCSLAAF
jgi:hypothetical protein